MKRVLVVDDEEDMLWMLQRNLNKGMSEVEVLAASSGEEALAVLSDKDINLVITDINMPGMNGLDLLIEVNNRYPETGVIIMTAYPSNSFEREAMMGGSLRFVEKPFDIKDMRQIVGEVLKTNEGFQGTLDGIDLIDIVQFNGLSKATSALKVTTADQEGMIFFKKGEVVHAMCDNTSGEDAFFKILEFQGGTLQNIRGVEPPIVSIQKNIESLLFESAVRNDEETSKSESKSPKLQSSFLDIFARGEPETEKQRPDNKPTIDTNSGLERKLAGRDREEPNTTEDMEMTDIQKILAEFTNIDGVHTACLVGRDGFLLDNIARSGIDAEMIGAIASSGFGSAESMGNQLGQGDLNLTMLEYTDGPVMFAPVGSEAFLVIVADKDTNLGWIRLTIKKNSKVIEQAADL
jgi:predicted regulator of Ras-like GTPase activity (Roadblock/LC7/MglB family)/DNA-binding response OmpR family regulator